MKQDTFRMQVRNVSSDRSCLVGTVVYVQDTDFISKDLFYLRL